MPERMKRLLLAAAAALLAAGCDDAPNVVVTAEREGRPVADLPVRLLPYDRRAILDSLAAAADRPEPAPPQELVRRFEALRRQRSLLPPGDSTAPRVDAALAAALDTLRAYQTAREAWADTVFAALPAAIEARMGRSSLGERADTTDADGRAAFAAEPGEWWVSATYVLPEAVLEWSLPVRVAEGDSAVVRLDPARATRRPFY